MGQPVPFWPGSLVARQNRVGSGWPPPINGLDIVTRPVLGRADGPAGWPIFFLIFF